MQEWRGCAWLLPGCFGLAVVALGSHEAELRVSEDVVVSATHAVLGGTNQQVTVMVPHFPPDGQVGAHLAQ